MESWKVLTLTEGAVTGLVFIHRYRFLTIPQFAHTAGFSFDHAAEVLRRFESRGIVGHFGHVGIPGRGKTPKVYFLKRKGFELLKRECDLHPEALGSFVEAHMEASWSPQMYHRLRLLDPRLALVKTLLEYRRVRRGGRIARETTDFVAEEETPENRIIPDAAFVLENR